MGKPESAMVLSRGFIAFVLAIATTIAAPTQDTVVPESSLTELKESPPLPGAFSAKAHDGDSANAALSEVAPLEKPQSVVPMTSLLGMVRHSKGYTLEAIQMLAEKWNNQMRPGYVPREHDVVVTIRTALRGIEAKLETARTEAVSEEDEVRIKAQQDIIDSMKEQLNKLTKITSAPSFSPTPAPTDEFAFRARLASAAAALLDGLSRNRVFRPCKNANCAAWRIRTVGPWERIWSKRHQLPPTQDQTTLATATSTTLMTRLPQQTVRLHLRKALPNHWTNSGATRRKTQTSSL